MLELKITTVGNSAGVVVEIPSGYQLTPYDETLVRQVRAAERVLKDQRDVLRELAR